MVYCKICNRGFASLRSIGTHIRHSHKNISCKEYYDLYLKEPGEGICKYSECINEHKKEPAFVSLSFGYKDHCCYVCSGKDPKVREKQRDTNTILYGEPNYCNKEQIPKTKFERYGMTNYVNQELRRKNENLIAAKEINEELDKTKYELISNNTDEYKFKHLVCGNEIIIKGQMYRRRRTQKVELCNICNPYYKLTSLAENELCKFIKDNYKGEVIENTRKIISPKELDIYLPELKLAIEFNGVFYHSSVKQPNKDYHLNKTNLCESLGIQLIHIFEDDWNFKKSIVKSIILNLMKKYSKEILLSECNIEEIDIKESEIFLNENSINGFKYCNSIIGLKYKNELVSVMSFDKIGDNQYELVNFCNKLNIKIGGSMDNLFMYFTDKHKADKIISYVSRDWNSIKNVYDDLGFELKELIEPDFKFVDYDKRIDKEVYIKEDVLLEDIRFPIIYNSGTLKYEWKNRV